MFLRLYYDLRDTDLLHNLIVKKILKKVAMGFLFFEKTNSINSPYFKDQVILYQVANISLVPKYCANIAVEEVNMSHLFVQCQSYKLFNNIIIIIITLITIFIIIIQVEVGLTSPVIQTLLEPFVDRLIIKKKMKLKMAQFSVKLKFVDSKIYFQTRSKYQGQAGVSGCRIHLVGAPLAKRKYNK